MIVPSIDLLGGQAVQLIGGETPAIEAGDPRPIADRFARVGETAVIDLDAARGEGTNTGLIEDLVRRAPCRVGGGIRDVDTAIRWLDAGARSVILGTAARPEILRALPRERVIAALDARDGEVVVEGWRTKTGASVVDRMRELRDHVGGFLVTFVELEGRLGGSALDRVEELVREAGEARVTIAGGVTNAEEVAELDRMGADAQVGMALYSGRLALTDAFAAPLTSDRPDGLWPTVVTDEHGVALGLAYSNLESLTVAIEEGAGVYWSRNRGLWRKGATSGATQRLLRVDADCDRDALRFVVRQEGVGFCHTGSTTCWGEQWGVPALNSAVQERLASAPAGSYTRRLFDDADLLRSKLLEEAGELADATTPDEAAWEAADVLYFAMVRAAAGGADLDA
ncbi:MAG: phosphoribosyl-ATP diphosphatase, partial [Planctomycetota bacterium]